MTRKLKDNGGVQVDISHNDNPWQAKVYKVPVLRQAINAFIPKKGTKEYRKMQTLMKDSASTKKMEWIYINRIFIAIITFVLTIVFSIILHKVAINYVYTEPTTEQQVLGKLSDKK